MQDQPRQLARINIKGQGETAQLTFINSAGESASFLLTPENLPGLFEAAIQLLLKWSHRSSSDPNNAPVAAPASDYLPAQQIAIVRAERLALTHGATLRECAVRLFFGHSELTFVLPLNQVVPALDEFRRRVVVLPQEPEGDETIH